jgi:integrase
MPRQRRDVPWIETHRNGTYYIHWYDAAEKRTKRESTGASDAVAAQKIFAAWLTDPSLREPSRLDGLTVSQILDDYRREHVAEKVIDRGRAELAIMHLKTFFGSTPARDVDIPLSRSYRAARRAVGTSDGTIRRELVVLRAAAGHAARWKRIGPNANPPSGMPSIELPSESQQETPWLTVDELGHAISTAPTSRLWRFIRILYYTAARRHSIEAMTKSQVDLKHGLLNLRSPDESVLQRHSKKRRPIVPIHPEIRPDIEQLMVESPNQWLWGDDMDMYKQFTTHMKKIGLGHKGHPHVLRHSRATHLLHQGVQIFDVAKLLGDTVGTVERVYGHACLESLSQTIRRTA